MIDQVVVVMLFNEPLCKVIDAWHSCQSKNLPMF